MVKVRITQLAKEDLKSIKLYIQRDSYQNSIKIIETILDKLQLLEQYPEIGKIIAHTNNGPLRQIIVYKYRIIYRFQNNTVEVLTIHHGSRLLSNNPGIGEYFDE
ncbi:MAG: type II toxin-antitoxin system RelE/ParE family toxin [Bacteroidetes bacterium]|nr:type II toxin-antitoxin system RelE/ParE family toxin [Bacteroidota bacterium]